MRSCFVATVLVALAGLGACGKAATPAPAPSASVLGGYAAVPADDARLQTAVAKGVAQLRGTDWLAAPDLAAGPITAGERQVVAGTNHRAALTLSYGGAARQARLTVFEDLQGRFQVTAVDLGPPGSDAPLLDTPAAQAMPGGWADRSPDDPDVAATAARASALLAAAAWLGRPVTVDRVAGAKTQVVAGLNTYLALDAQVDGFPHRVELIVYEPLQGEATLSWVRLAAPELASR